MIRYISIVTGICLSTATVYAQSTKDTTQSQLNKSILVVTEYQPSVSDATKINQLPQVNDTMKVNPNFQYSIESKPISTYYSLKEINAARIKGTPLQPLYRLLLEGGIGNYWTTFANIRLNSLRSKSFVYGAGLQHFSQQGDINLTDDLEVPAGHSLNALNFYGKKFIKDMIITGDANLQRKVVNRYGYYIEDSILTIPYDTVLDEDKIKQTFYMIDANIGIKSKALDSTKLHYDFNAGYKFTTPRAMVQEQDIAGNLKMFKYISDFTVGGDIGFEYFNLGGVTGDSLRIPTNSILTISPWAQTVRKQWKGKVGFSIVNVWGYDQFHFYPYLAFDYNIVDNIVIPYIEYSGWLESNNYRSISMENPYIIDSLTVKPTSYQNIFKVGLRGNLSKNIPYNVFFGYSDINDMHLYVNEFSLTDSAQNMFNVVYDDVNILNIHAETGYQLADKISVMIDGDYFSYSLVNEEKAWHKPSYEIGLTAKYNMQNKIIASVEMNYIGGMYSKNVIDSSAIKMKDIFDLNLSVEYRYTKNLSAFLRINNLIASDYSIWQYYPSYRFTAMLGVTYAIGKEK